MKISLLILRWWRCFSYLHIQRIGMHYTDQLFFANNTLGTVDIIFINKLQFLIFFHFSDLRNIVKCMDSMAPSYSLLSLKVIWLCLASAPSVLGEGEGRWGGGWVQGNLIWRFAKILGWQNFFLHLWQINLYRWS